MTADIPRLSIGRFASMVAALADPFADKRSILEDAGLSDEQWRQLRTRHQAEIASAPGGEEARSFAAAFEEARAALASGSPPAAVAKLGPDVSEPAPPEQAAPEPAAAPSPAFHPPAAPLGALAVAPLGSPSPAPPALAASVDETAAFSASMLDAPCLPFADKPAPPPAEASAELSPHPEVGETSWERPALDVDHLPFGPTPQAPAEPEAAELDIDETAALGMAAIVDDEPLPFADGPAVAPQQSAVEPTVHRARGKTAYMRAMSSEQALPFDGGGSQPPPPKTVFSCAPITLEQLAAVHVELELAPASHAEVLAHYRLTPEVKHSLDRELFALAERDSTVKTAWDEACRIYRSWRQAQGQGG